MRVPVIKNFPFTLDGARFEQAFSGTEVDLPDTWIDDLRRKGYVGGDEVPISESDPPKRPRAKAGLVADILAAAEMLDPENSDHFTTTGLPQVKALEALLGYYITAEERDTAWAARPAE